MRAALITLAALLAALALTAPAAGAAPTTFVVNSTADTGDGIPGDNACDTDGPGPGSTCTLRAAIQQANADTGGAGAPYTIALGALAGQTITPASDLDAITADGTVIEGCASEQTVGPCVGLRSGTAGSGTGLDVEASGVTLRSLAISRFAIGVSISGSGAIVRNSAFGLRVDGTTAEGMARGILAAGSGARIGGNAPNRGNTFVDNGDAVLIWGGDNTEVAGNRIGLRRDGTLDPNARGIVVAGVAGVLPGQVADEATGNVIGGTPTYATSDLGAVCVTSCNRIAGSTIAGIDLDSADPAQTPAGGLLIAGNWLGIDDDGDAAANKVAIHVGDGGKLVPPDSAGAFVLENLISGNDAGIDQAGGKGVLSVIANVFGLAPPDLDAGLPNAGTNATLGGDYGGRDALVAGNNFGATDKGLVLTGPQPCVGGNIFSPPVGTYTTAAIVIESGAKDARIGNELGCFSGYSPRNLFGRTAPGAPAILVRGADGFSIVANDVGTIPYAAPLAGPAVRIVDGQPGDDPSVGGRIGGDSPNLWNTFTRLSGPAVEVDGHASGIVVAGGQGIAVNDFASASSLWTDLLSISGLGNAPTGQNGGIQPPTITVATTAGIAGTGEPGAAIRVLQRWRADKPDGVDEPYPEGYTLPPMGATTTVAPDGTWSLGFLDRLPEGQGITASQTTAAGSSEFAALKTTTLAPPLPIVQITGGPAGTVSERSARFTFITPTPGATLECALDAGPFAPCTSPATYGPLETGAHQFRVQARLGDQVSLPVSRTWAIDAPITPPAKTPSSATAAQRFAALVSLPSSKRCLSKRTIRLRVRKAADAKVVYAQIRVTGKRTRTVIGRALNSAIDLRGLPKGTIKVRVRVLLSNGKTITGSRTYRTCAKRKPARPRR